MDVFWTPCAGGGRWEVAERDAYLERTRGKEGYMRQGGGMMENDSLGQTRLRNLALRPQAPGASTTNSPMSPPASSPRVHPDPRQTYPSAVCFTSSIGLCSVAQPSGVRGASSLAQPGTTQLLVWASHGKCRTSPFGWDVHSRQCGTGGGWLASGSSKYLQSSGDAGNGKPVPFLNARSTSGRTSP